MIDRAAKCRHEAGNRRYHQWVFDVSDASEVLRMTHTGSGKSSVPRETAAPVRELPRLRPDEFLTYDECDGCRGKGCRACDNTGEVVIIRREQKKQKFGVMT